MRASLLPLVLLAGCDLLPQRYARCERDVLGTLDADESWEGVTPSMAVGALDQRTGTWLFRHAYEPDSGHSIELSSTARLASPALILEVDIGEDSCGTMLEVPLFVELESPDGAWRFSGEVTYQYRPDLREWILDLSDAHPPLLRAEAFEDALIPHAFDDHERIGCEEDCSRR